MATGADGVSTTDATVGADGNDANEELTSLKALVAGGVTVISGEGVGAGTDTSPPTSPNSEFPPSGTTRGSVEADPNRLSFAPIAVSRAPFVDKTEVSLPADILNFYSHSFLAGRLTR